jgi:hypothetical protein
MSASGAVKVRLDLSRRKFARRPEVASQPLERALKDAAVLVAFHDQTADAAVAVRCEGRCYLRFMRMLRAALR